MVVVPGSFKTRDIQRYDHHKVSVMHDVHFSSLLLVCLQQKLGKYVKFLNTKSLKITLS